VTGHAGGIETRAILPGAGDGRAATATLARMHLAFVLGTPELMIILVVVLVLFGGAKLPELARSLGQAKREFEQGVQESSSTEETTSTPAEGHS
jgi:sec-independent protein translocase protein TatA